MNIGPIELTNTVSGVVFGVLLIVIGGLAWLLREIYKTRSASEQAASNSVPTSNGFAKGVKEQLNHLVKTVDSIQEAHTKHLQWHMERERDESRKPE